jgi:hypothetical protein
VLPIQSALIRDASTASTWTGHVGTSDRFCLYFQRWRVGTSGTLTWFLGALPSRVTVLNQGAVKMGVNSIAEGIRIVTRNGRQETFTDQDVDFVLT